MDEQRWWVVLDVGCIECGEATSVLGVFSDKARADAVSADHRARQRAAWGGQHSFEVYALPGGLNWEHRVVYGAEDEA